MKVYSDFLNKLTYDYKTEFSIASKYLREKPFSHRYKYVATPIKVNWPLTDKDYPYANNVIETQKSVSLDQWNLSNYSWPKMRDKRDFKLDYGLNPNNVGDILVPSFMSLDSSSDLETLIKLLSCALKKDFFVFLGTGTTVSSEIKFEVGVATPTAHTTVTVIGTIRDKEDVALLASLRMFGVNVYTQVPFDILDIASALRLTFVYSSVKEYVPFAGSLRCVDPKPFGKAFKINYTELEVSKWIAETL